ncbi:hypothetical protein [Hyphomonas sp.]|uniref:hypothetical protein n=1 Tax=Hyphomonas sp. TaxID=87 RepID=UPI0025B939E1|nr:hypothetical protein [Hyphomonas sp.]
MARPQYFVVQNHEKEAFEVAVESNLNDGWRLVGGLFMTTIPTYDGGPVKLHYCQAMTKGGKHA